MIIKDLLQDETVKIGNKEVSLLDLFNIQEETVSTDMMQQASLYAHIGMLKVKLEARRNKLKQKRDEIYANLDIAYRDNHKKYDEKFTEKTIESEIKTDEGYIEILERLAIAEEDYAMFEVMTRALEMRANMLQSIGAYLRMEQSMTGMHTNEYEKTIQAMKNKIKK